MACHRESPGHRGDDAMEQDSVSHAEKEGSFGGQIGRSQGGEDVPSRQRETESARDIEAEADGRRCPMPMSSMGITSLSVAPSSLPIAVSSDNASDRSQIVLFGAASPNQDLQLRLVQSGAREGRDTEKEPGEISDGSGAEEGELEGEVLMEIQHGELCRLSEQGVGEGTFSPVAKKRKLSSVVRERDEKQTRSKMSGDSSAFLAAAATAAGDDPCEVGHSDFHDIHTVHGDVTEGKKRLKSRKSSRHRKDIHEVSPQSRSSESEIAKAYSRGDSVDGKRRKRSKEGLRDERGGDRHTSKHSGRPHENHHNSHHSRPHRRGGSVERKHRSLSRESVRKRKGDDSRSHHHGGSVERKHRSLSRESDRKRKGDDSDTQRHGDRETLGWSGRHDRDNGRHGGRKDNTQERSRKNSHTCSASVEKKRRSRSRESLRNQKVDSRHGGDLDSTLNRSSSRHGMRTKDTDRSHRDGHEVRNGSLREGGRDRSDKDDRARDRGYSDHQKRDRDRGNTKQISRQETNQVIDDKSREEENQEEYQERVELQLAAQEEDDVERIKEESRRRRQAILEKYRQQQETDTEQSNDFVRGPTAPSETEGGTQWTQQTKVSDHATENYTAPSASEGSAYPTEQTRDGGSGGHTTSVTLNPLQNGSLTLQTTATTGALGEGSPKSEQSADMFCDDIFGESPAGGRRLGKADGLAIDTSGLTDNWDDAEGRYCFLIGEILDGRYEVLSAHGSGVFSTVLRARDMKAGPGDPEEVAVKIIRNNETMFRTGQQELVILRKVAGADPENRRHCVRLLSSFEYRNHLCLVFESLHMNLREILKKFGRNIGIKLSAVRAYAKQLFIALKHLRNCGVLHCDIKPDNMLVNDAKNVLKLCDFGSAMFASTNEITPYLVSRFYRAPEIILGLPYDHALDVWSVGCCLYELYSGKMLFPGQTNNEMLRLHMELKGPFPKKMLKKAKFKDQHFDHEFNFCASEDDPVTKKMVKRIIMNGKAKDMGVLVASLGAADEDSKMLAHFKDLLEKMFILDPDKRITVSQALNHPFISGK